MESGVTSKWHLYEVVISNPRVWLKVQASCSSSEQSAAFFECRFNGIDYITDEDLPVTPFRLSARADYVANWTSIVDRLPEGWDDDDFHIEGTPYPWCESLSEDCDCHGTKGGLGNAYCSDFGLLGETEKRESKSPNVRYQNYIREMEERIVQRDESQRKERRERQRRASPRRATPVAARSVERGTDHTGGNEALAQAMNAVNGLVAQGFYCSIDGRHHAYGAQPVRKTVASLAAACAQMATWAGAERQTFMSQMGAVATHWLRTHQSEECAQRSVWGDADIPDTLYKYIPRELIGKGAPGSLRATQLLALNDDMECNVTTMKGGQEADTLVFLRLVQSKLEEHLGIAVPWEELLTRSNRYGDLRLSTYIQEHLNPLVGVVSLSTDILVPTMWAHYARNTGIVVGYDTEALRALGFELRPVVYSEFAPTYEPSSGDAIRLDFVDREDMERNSRAGRNAEGFPLLARTELAKFGAGWKSLSRILLVKGMSWAYEKEVRLLVDLEQARDTGKEDGDGWAVKVIDPYPEAIKEIYRGAKTREVDVQRAVQAARGDNWRGLFVGHVSSHAFRIQKTGGVRH